jgi:H+-transporting ATPase
MIKALAPPLAAPAPIDASANTADANSSAGLSSGEARELSDKFGPNSMPDTSSHPARMAIEKLWAPIPWMLEAAIVLQIVLGEYVEAAIRMDNRGSFESEDFTCRQHMIDPNR